MCIMVLFVGGHVEDVVITMVYNCTSRWSGQVCLGDLYEDVVLHIGG